MNSLSLTPRSDFLLLDRRFQIEEVNETDRGTEVKVVGPEGVSTTKSLEYLLHQYAMGNLKAAGAGMDSPRLPAGVAANTHPLAADLPSDDLEVGRRRWKLLWDIKNSGGFLRDNHSFWEFTFPDLCAQHGFAVSLSRSTVTRWLKKLAMNRPDFPGGSYT